jgi:hypothetical protein
MREETGDRRNVPPICDEWKLVNVPSVPSFSQPGAPRLALFETWDSVATPPVAIFEGACPERSRRVGGTHRDTASMSLHPHWSPYFADAAIVDGSTSTISQ